MPPAPVMPPWAPAALSAVVVALALDGGTAYAGLADGRVLRSASGGGPWEVVADALGPGPVALLAVPGALLLGGPDGLDRLGADGRPLPTDGLPEAPVVSFARTGDVAVAGTDGHGVFRSEDDGRTWTASNGGLPFRGAGLDVSGFATTEAALFVAHGLGVSRSRDAGRAWETAGAGLPLRIGRLAVAASGPRVFAEADGRLFQLDGDAWAERDAVTVGLLGADADAIYALDPDDGLVWRAADGGPWRPYGDGLPAPPHALAPGPAWRLAALATGGLWRRPATPPPASAPAPRLDGVPAFLMDTPAEVALWLPTPDRVVLSLLGADGAEAARLADGPFAAGAHTVLLSADGLSPGLYRCRLAVADHVVSRPLAVL